MGVRVALALVMHYYMWCIRDFSDFLALGQVDVNLPNVSDNDVKGTA